MPESEDEFSKDMLRGGSAIAHFLFGDPQLRRKVYHLKYTSRLPVFRLGTMICARRSVLLKWIEDQERQDAAKRNSDKRGSDKDLGFDDEEQKPH